MFESYYLQVIFVPVGSVSSYWLIAINNRTQTGRKLAKFPTLDALLQKFQETNYVTNEIIEEARRTLTNGAPFVVREIDLSEKELKIMGLEEWV